MHHPRYYSKQFKAQEGAESLCLPRNPTISIKDFNLRRGGSNDAMKSGAIEESYNKARFMVLLIYGMSFGISLE